MERSKGLPKGLVASAFALAAILAWLTFIGRGSEEVPTPVKTQPIPPNLENKEAPMLQELVASGALPPLSERLPKNPAVVVPAEQPGRYGGVWRRYAMGQDANAMGRLIYEPALRWSGDGRTIEPNLCWKYEVSRDSRVFTFWMREGVRWSDGEYLTTEDVRFWWEDFVINKDVNPVAPIWMQIQGELPDFQVLGPYKYRFVFPISYGLFLERAAWQGRMWMPKHYLKQFHINYRNRDELERLARDAGFNAWHQLFTDKALWRSNPEVPMINAWVIKNSWSSHHRIFERNPYYWKVDTEGRQLPYIDRVTHDNVQDRAALLFKLMSGDVLLQSRHVGFKDLPLFDDAIRKGKVRIIEWTESGNSGISILFNQSYTGKDLFAGNLMREKNFRWAVSYALPRREISELFLFGLGTPAQAAPIEQSPYYQYGRKYAETAIEYDLVKANWLLDELGLAPRDQEGYRLRPDGEPVAVTIDHGASTEWTQMAEYFSQRCLGSIGIKGILKPSTGLRGYTGKPQLILGGGIGRNMQLLIQPFEYIPFHRYCAWASQYGLWYLTNGARGWTPPEPLRRVLEIYDRIKTCPDQEERYRLMGQIIDLHADNLWMISSLKGIPVPVVVSPRSGNVPEDLVSSWLFFTPSNAHPEQFYLKW